MSQYSNNRGRDAGKKYTSLNINQTYKGSKGENKLSTGNRSHGLQSLGKVQSRRVITPANLPSLKSENSGNDPTVNLVPSGSQGWGKKETSTQQPLKTQDGTATTGASGPTKPIQPKPETTQEISLRPNAGVAPSAIPTETTGKASWGNKANSNQPSGSAYFQREFPTLGEDDVNQDTKPEGKDQSEEGEPNANPQGMGHPNIMNGQKWMENMPGMPVPPNFPFTGERPMFNGNQQPFPYPYAGYMPPPSGRGMPMPGYYPFPFPGGKMPPFDPNFMQRMPKLPFMPPPSNKTDRPSVVKDSDLKQLDEDKDEIGWDAAQDDVDYNAKLKFDESDESDDDNGESKRHGESGNEKEKSDQKRQKGPPNWQPYPGFPPQMLNWPRMQFPPGYEPPRGSAPPHGYPIHPYFYMHYGMPPNMQQQQPPQSQQQEKEKAEEDHALSDTEKAKKFAPLKEDKTEAQRKAAAQEKLRKLEEKMRLRELGEEKSNQIPGDHSDVTVEDLDKQDEKNEGDTKEENRVETNETISDSSQHARSRNNSEASDSSRRSNKEKDVPPRFQRKRSGQQDGFTNSSENLRRSESPQMRIMRRKDSEDSQKDEKFKEGQADPKPQGRSRENSGTLYQETAKSEHHKRIGSSSESHEKLSRQSSSSSVHSNKENDKKSNDKVPMKKELKDLSESKKSIKKEKKSRELDEDDVDRKLKKTDNRGTASQRFNDMKLSKGAKKNTKEAVPTKDQKEISKAKTETNKSPWNKVVVGAKDDKPTAESKSLVQIQKEEEEEEIRQKSRTEQESKKRDPKEIQDRHSPDENKFRSDNMQRYDQRKMERETRDDRADNHGYHRNERNDRQERSERGDKKSRHDDRKAGGQRGERGEGAKYRDEYKDRRNEERYKDRYKDTRKDVNNKRDDYSKKEYDYRKDSRPSKKGDYDKVSRDGSAKNYEKRDEKIDVQTKSDETKTTERRDKNEGVHDRSSERRDENRSDRSDSRSGRRPSNRTERDGPKRTERRNYRDEDKEYKYSRRNETERSENRRNDGKDARHEKRNDWKREDHSSRRDGREQRSNEGKKSSYDSVKASTSNTSLEGKKNEDKPQDRPTTEEKTGVGDNQSKETDGASDPSDYKRSSVQPKGNEPKYERKSDYGEKSRERDSRGKGRGRTSASRGSNDRYSGRQSKYDDSRSADLSDTENEERKKEPRDGNYKEEGKRPSSHLTKGFTSFDPPPRFREGKGSFRTRGRGDVSRGGSFRGRSRGRGGSSSYPQPSDQPDEGKKGVEEEDFFSAQESADSHSSEDKDENKHYIRNESREKRSMENRRGRSNRGRGLGRGTGRGTRNSFLGNRQQVGMKEKTREGKTLPAADENIGESGNSQITTGSSTLEEISVHSPPKKIKTQEKPRDEKKRDISREFDLNNIASVVCIDDMPSSDQQAGKHLDDDGFVTVTSKKQQREARDRQREEEKKKLKIEQKKEAFAANKLQKERRKEAPKETVVAAKATKPVPAENIPVSGSVEQTTVIPCTTVVSVSTTVTTVASQAAPASNAAMAAIGGWEPAQSLMRTSQLASDQGKPPTSSTTNVNAWQRPLSLSATTTSEGPDPRAVGTGKPSSSQSAIMKPGVVPSQPTPESASPLITPPALTPIGTSAPLQSVTSHLPTTVEVIEPTPSPPPPPTSIPSVVENPSKENNENAAAPSKPTKPASKSQKKEGFDRDRDRDRDREKRRERQSSDKKETKPTKRTSNKVERPPRFQNKKDNEDYSKYDDRKFARDRDRPPREEYKSRKRTADRQRKHDSSKTSDKPAKPVKDTLEKKSQEDASDNVFTTDVTVKSHAKVPETSTKSILSDAEKVVGSKKPSLKSQSSVGSFTTDTAVIEEVVEAQLQSENFQEPFTLASKPDHKISQEEEERNAKHTARSVIKSLSEDDERSLETRSLPGTPPLVVKIPEPTLSGPSSDPGRAPTPTKAQVPSMELENEMNRRLFNTRSVWEDSMIARNWTSDSASVSSVSSGTPTVAPSAVASSVNETSKVPVSISEKPEAPVSPTKATPDSPVVSSVSEQPLVKSSEEKSSIAPGFASTAKRPEQQVCKVKPQQQLPQAEEAKRLHNGPIHSLTSQRGNSIGMATNPSAKYTSYILPERPSTQSTLYTASESQYPDQFRSQTTQQFQQSLSQVRSMDHSTSSISQQQHQQQQHRDIMLPSIPVSNLYGNPAGIQTSQNPLLAAWPMVSPPNIQQQQQQQRQQGQQQSKTVAYQTNYHTSLFTSSPSLGSSPLIMQHDNFSQQRTTGAAIQRQQVSLMQLSQQQQQHQQQHQTNNSNGLIGIIPQSAQARPTIRREQHYGTDPLTNANHMTLLLNQSSNAALQQQSLTAAQQQHQQQQQQNTDLTKHVNAKPFEPTTQTPPLVQSPPVIQQSVQLAQQQQIMSTILRHSTSSQVVGNHQQLINRHNQQQQRHSIQALQHHQQQQQQQQNPVVAPIRPRSVTQLPANSPPQSSLASQDRINSMTYPSNIQAMMVNSMGGRRQVAPPTHNVQHMSAVPTHTMQNLQNQFVHSGVLPQQLQQQRNVTRATSIPPNRTGMPGPIQRPTQVTSNHLNFSSVQHPPPPTVQSSGSNDPNFKSIQRQKMLEDTKKYFAQQDQKGSGAQEKEKIDEKPLSNGNTKISSLDSTKKLVISESDLKDKKYDLNKNTSKSGSMPQDYQNRNTRNVKRQPPVNDAKKKREPPNSTTAVPNRRNVPSKV